jgi:hypothetical protein
MNIDHEAGIIDTLHTIDTTTQAPQGGPAGTLLVVGDGAIRIPLGPDATRPPNDAGLLRYSTTQGLLEYNDGTRWITGSDEDMAYSKRVDFVTDDLFYRGEALPGTQTNEPEWRIRRLTVANDCDVTEEWANGNANFDKVWDDHLALTYL